MFINDIFSLVQNHSVAALAWVFALAMLLGYEFLQWRLKDFYLTPQEAVRWFNQKNAVILDLRERNLFLDGHIAGSKHLPTLEIASKEIKSLDKKNPIILISTDDAKAMKFAKILKAQFAEVFVLQQGIKAWMSAQLPLVKK